MGMKDPGRPPAVAGVLQQVTATARRHAMFSRGSIAVVAVSGGQDSLCLLHALWRLRGLFGIRLACFHFDHRLSEGSKADAMYVRRQAARLGIPFVLRRAESAPGRGESVEAWARMVRYRALGRVVEELGASSAAVGHTADDQAETVLMALLRGAGVEALSGMKAVNPPIVRPLLETGREETAAFCRALRLSPRDDPMNHDPSYMRVAIRRQVIPMLERRLRRNVKATLVRTARQLAEDAEFLERMADSAQDGVLVRQSSGPALRAGPLCELPRPLATRVVRRALLQAGLVAEAAHVDAVLSLAAGRTGRQVILPHGLLARRDKEYVRFLLPSLRASAAQGPEASGVRQGRRPARHRRNGGSSP